MSVKYRFCDLWQPTFLPDPQTISQLSTLPFSSPSLEIPGLQMWKKQPVLKTGHPCGLGQASGISGQPTALEETITHRDAFWLPVGILAQWEALSRINRFLVWVFSPQMGMQDPVFPPSFLFPPKFRPLLPLVQTIALVWSPNAVFFFKVELWPHHLFSTVYQIHWEFFNLVTGACPSPQLNVPYA